MICENIYKIRERIAEQRTDPNEVTLIAVSKGQPVLAIEKAYHCNVHDFGENYVQEAVAKIKMLTEKTITWHYLGRLQSNKLKQIVQYFDVIHSLDQFDHAERLNTLAQNFNKVLKVFVQVNLDAEAQKGGLLIKKLPLFVERLSALKYLNLAGLMLIPAVASPEVNFEKFKILKALSIDLATKTAGGLSMGMSQDYEWALRAGATAIRLGTAIFGLRTLKN